MSREHWETLPPLVDELIQGVARAYGVGVTISHTRGVPPVINDAASIGTVEQVARDSGNAITGSEQSLGGEDFAWYLERVPGALARLGVRTPGSTSPMDLHQSGFDVDERCIAIGVQLLTGLARSGA
ncbi:MAG: hypothetical protein JO246_17290 [Frankiaceae bacterium]|nr:hypothetical protein [Frankiaceae bacterium]